MALHKFLVDALGIATLGPLFGFKGIRKGVRSLLLGSEPEPNPFLEEISKKQAEQERSVEVERKRLKERESSRIRARRRARKAGGFGRRSLLSGLETGFLPSAQGGLSNTLG